MTDGELVEKVIEKIRHAKARAIRFNELSAEQLNYKPDEDKWSVGQCLDHLVVSDMLYFPALKKIAEGKYKMKTWERISPFSKLFGKMLADQVTEQVKRKLKAPKVLKPSSSNIDTGIHERFQKHLDTLIAYISACSREDIDKIRITSPVSKFITYNLRHTFIMLSQHLHRHLNQAERIIKVI